MENTVHRNSHLILLRFLQGSRSLKFWDEIRPNSQCQKRFFFPIYRRKIPNLTMSTWSDKFEANY